MDIKKVKERILKLRAMVPERGASEQEAMFALEKADELMQEFGLTEADLESADAQRDMRTGEFTYSTSAPHPITHCINTIARFCEVKSWYNRYNRHVAGYGFKRDVEMYEFLTQMIHDSMNRGWETFRKENPKQPGESNHRRYWSFMLGFANRINARLQELIDKRPTGKGLVVKKMAVVEAAYDNAVGRPISKSKGRGRYVSGDAYKKGQAAGNRVNLNRPLRNATGQEMLR